MSPRQWCALMAFYTAYLFFGASVFYYTEREYEVERRLHELQDRIRIHELLAKYTAPDDEYMQHDILHKVTAYCGKKVTNHTLDEFVDPYQWTFYHSVFFAFTVCSTLGYGNIAPTQAFGRYFMIVYALVGIPVNGILYAYLGDYFGQTFVGAYNRYKAYKIANNKHYVPQRWGMIAQITLYLVPAAIVLIFLPSCLFTYFEGWPYSVSVYYSFVTLSTIGFGDFIPTFQPHQERVFGVWFQLYQAFIIIWFVFGLSYLLMLIGFIARGMRSKQISRLEHQLSENIKLTQQRIWTGVTRDVSYLRKIFNEIYIMRFKPAYEDGANDYVYNILTRSESCPNFAMYHPHYAHHHHHHHNYHPSAHHSSRVPRKRAHSEHDTSAYSGDIASIKSPDGQPPTRRSNADLLRIDRLRALDDPLLNVMHTGDVLARVVQALDSIGQLKEGAIVGRHNLTDSQILADELHSFVSPMTSPCQTPPLRPRMRAASEYRGIPSRPADSQGDDHEWTWSGTEAQIQELRKMRAKMNRTTYDLHRQAVSGAHAISIEISPTKEPEPTAETPKSHRRRASHFARNLLGQPSRKNSIAVDADPLSSAVFADAAPPTDAVRRQYLNATNRGRPSVFATIDSTDQQLLEKTTIADLIRAIEVAHIQEHVPEGLLTEPIRPLLARSPRLQEVGRTRRASMFPGFHGGQDASAERVQKLQTRRSSSLLEAVENGRVDGSEPAVKPVNERQPTAAVDSSSASSSDEMPPEPATSALFHKRTRRASMFPANFKSFQKLTDTILSDGSNYPQTQLLTPVIAGQRATSPTAAAVPLGLLRPAIASARRASVCPSRRLLPGTPTTQPHTTTSFAHAHGAGRRVSLIPGAGRHAIPERLLREYAHVPRETQALSRQQQKASGRQSRHFLSAPIGGAFAMPMSPARRKNSATKTVPMGAGTSAAAANTLSVISPLVTVSDGSLRDGRTTSSSPHLNEARRDSVGLLQQHQQRGRLHSIFRPFQAGESEAAASAQVAEASQSDSSGNE